MAVALTLTDSEGRLWDFSGGNPIGSAYPGQTGQVVNNGTADAYDGGLGLAVNGQLFNTNVSSLGVNGRELNLAPVIMAGGTVAVTRSFLVSDATISSTGFARVLDSFTNLTNVSRTITVEFVTDVGSDGTTAVVADTNGNNIISISDFGYVTDESTNLVAGDSSVGFAYGDGRGLAPIAAGPSLAPGINNDEFIVRYSITLAPGETRSLLSFGFQNTTAAQGIADLPFFTRSLQALDASNFLAGISAAERATIVNYTEGLRGRPDFVLTDGGGTQWGIDVGSRTMATIGSSAVQEASFGNGSFGPAFGNLASSGLGEDGREVSYRYTGSVATVAGSSIDYSYFAAPDRNWVRQLVSFNGGPGVLFLTPPDGLLVQTGGSLLSDIPQTGLVGDNVVALDDRAWVFDDSASGADGTSPPLGVVVGNFQFNTGRTPGANDRATFSSGQLEVDRQQLLSGTQSFLFFFTSSETAGSTLASTAQLLTPGFRELAGMSDAEVASIRNFTLTSADRLDERVGTAGNDVLTGNYWGDQIDGLAGDDLITGGGSDDVLIGGAGRDTLSGGIGTDTLNGGTEGDQLYGDEGNDILRGDDGDDVLDGGLGSDTLIGGLGNDMYIVDNGADVIIDAIGQGIDQVYAQVNYQLTAGAEVEYLSTVLHAATDAISLTGNAFAQTVHGNAGANSLDGGGGNDELFGFGGNDIYTVRTAGTRVFEGVGQGADAVYATVSWVLTAGAEVEYLSTVLHAATDAINLTGNAFAQTVHGNAGANSLDGGGGNDDLFGFGGNDIYTVRTAGTRVFETAGQGADAAYATVSWVLTAGAEVEYLSTVLHAATDAIDLTGNAFAQTVHGNAGANRLDGGGGNDALFGFGGADTFTFSTLLGAGNVDVLGDFATGVDRLELDDAVFAGLAPGALAGGAFRVGAGAQDVDDRIIYDPSTGALFFDADGFGGAAQVQFATLASGLSIAAADIFVI